LAAFIYCGWISLLKHCEEGKMVSLEDLKFTIDQKKNVEDELDLAHEKMRKMEELIKKIKRKYHMKRCNWSCK
jgi:hypothetical protein